MNELSKLYLDERVQKVDAEFLEFEEESISEEDIKLISCLKPSSVSNKHNSIILYVTGKTDEFDFTKGRSDTIDGSPPDCI